MAKARTGQKHSFWSGGRVLRRQLAAVTPRPSPMSGTAMP
jgi:hypothetical protein